MPKGTPQKQTLPKTGGSYIRDAKTGELKRRAGAAPPGKNGGTENEGGEPA